MVCIDFYKLLAVISEDLYDQILEWLETGDLHVLCSGNVCLGEGDVCVRIDNKSVRIWETIQESEPSICDTPIRLCLIDSANPWGNAERYKHNYTLQSLLCAYHNTSSICDAYHDIYDMHATIRSLSSAMAYKYNNGAESLKIEARGSESFWGFMPDADARHTCHGVKIKSSIMIYTFESDFIYEIKTRGSYDIDYDVMI